MNGERILGEKKLEDQDEIRIGPLILQFELETTQENMPEDINQAEDTYAIFSSDPDPA